MFRKSAQKQVPLPEGAICPSQRPVNEPEDVDRVLKACCSQRRAATLFMPHRQGVLEAKFESISNGRLVFSVAGTREADLFAPLSACCVGFHTPGSACAFLTIVRDEAPELGRLAVDTPNALLTMQTRHVFRVPVASYVELTSWVVTGTHRMPVRTRNLSLGGVQVEFHEGPPSNWDVGHVVQFHFTISGSNQTVKAELRWLQGRQAAFVFPDHLVEGQVEAPVEFEDFVRQVEAAFIAGPHELSA